MVGGRVGIRGSLFAVLLTLVVTMTALFLLLTSVTVSREIERTSADEMDRSRTSFRELERQRQDMLLRQAALVASLPSLKALMTTNDQPTIADAGQSFWETSGSDMFALMREDGSLLALYANGQPLALADCAAALSGSRETPFRTTLVFASGRFFEVATEPISFAAGEQQRVLGYVSSGYELNDRTAQMIVRPPAGQIVFATGDRVIASTLDAEQTRLFAPMLGGVGSRTLTLRGENFLVTSQVLQAATATTPPVYLVVLQSKRYTTALLRQLNRGIVLLGVLLVLVGGVVALGLAGTVTRPLQALLRSTRQMGRGERVEPVVSTGPLELRELREAFETMHAAVETSQAKLVEGERQATIGRMASSISHDLRHYLSPIYANAEFLSAPGLSAGEREELLNEITEAARGMNELLDAMLTFSRTGIPVQRVQDSITAAARRALALIQPHPEAHGVVLSASLEQELEGVIDGKELQRAVYNLLLNACQAARGGGSSIPRVTLAVDPEVDGIRGRCATIRIRDNGAGVSEVIGPRLFEPFVSAGKESGVGLGLALVKRIATAHGGSAGMRRVGAETEFFLLIPLTGTPLADAAHVASLGASL